MHYVALVNGQERRVEVSELSPGHFQLVIDGRRMVVDSRVISPGGQTLLHGTDSYWVEIERHPSGGELVRVRGHAVKVEVMDFRTLSLRKTQETLAGPAGPMAVRAPMPGKVVAVLVREDQEVVEGQGLVVVEAMKMENELRAPRPGRVKNLTIEVGAAVESGVSLCVVE